MAETTSIVPVPFHGDIIEAFRDERGVWVSVRRICESLGLDPSSQRQKLQAKPWCRAVMNTSHDASGRQQSIYMVHLDCLPMWLATIEVSRVGEEVRPKLVAYQKECAQVLRDHFFGKPQPSTAINLFDQAQANANALAQANAIALVSTLDKIVATQEKLVATLERLAATPQLPQERELVLINPRERIRKFWPTVSVLTMTKIIRYMDTLHRNTLGRPCPQQSLDINSPLMIEREYLWMVDLAIDRYRPSGPLFDTEGKS